MLNALYPFHTHMYVPRCSSRENSIHEIMQYLFSRKSLETLVDFIDSKFVPIHILSIVFNMWATREREIGIGIYVRISANFGLDTQSFYFWKFTQIRNEEIDDILTISLGTPSRWIIMNMCEWKWNLIISIASILTQNSETSSSSNNQLLCIYTLLIRCQQPYH